MFSLGDGMCGVVITSGGGEVVAMVPTVTPMMNGWRGGCNVLVFVGRSLKPPLSLIP